VPEESAFWIQLAAILVVVCLGGLIVILVLAAMLRRAARRRTKPGAGPQGPDPWFESAKRLQDESDQRP